MNKKGYTLLEILVAVSIIGILTMIGVTSFRVANQKARDGRRQGDLEQIRAALEIYRTDVGAYPTTQDWPGSGNSLSFNGITYMQTIPSDPVEGNEYYYSSDGITYSLCAGLELDTSGSCDHQSCGEAECNYKITNPL